MRSVEISVVQGDALSHRADLLVLKYAQHLYGVDRKAVIRLGADVRAMPPVGQHLLLPARPMIGAEALLFLGVPDLEFFNYAEIREFGRRALSVAARVLPGARQLAMTLHGPGYGLDEIEAFESQVAGVLDAIAEREIPEGLERVCFVEWDERRVQRMWAALAKLIGDSRVQVGRPLADNTVERGTALHLESVGYDARDKLRAFVAMPFADEFEDVFHFGIAAPIRDAGMLCERMDKVEFTGDIVAEMTTRIAASRLVVADLTMSNPNVYLEVGYAWGRNVPTLLLCRDTHELKFDVQGQKCLRYKSAYDLSGKLKSTLPELLKTGTPSGPHTG
jgi:hypothetical protein